MDGHHVVIDEGIPLQYNRFMKRRLLVDGTGVLFGKDRIALSDVEAVAYLIVETRSGGVIHTATMHDFELWGRDGTHITIRIGSTPIAKKRSREAVDVFQSLVQFSREVIEPRLRDRLTEVLMGGTPVVIGPLSISRAGMSIQRKLRDDRTIPWSTFTGTDFAQGAVRVYAQGNDGHGVVATIPMNKPNAVLLPDLLRQVAKLSG